MNVDVLVSTKKGLTVRKTYSIFIISIALFFF